MKIQIASDLHLEFLETRFPEYRAVMPTDADVLVIAGDIHHHANAIPAFKDWGVPVVYVSGNHEFYDAHVDQMMDEMRRAAEGTHVHFLERDEWVFQGVRFLGCCLWTDYALEPEKKSIAMQEAEKVMIDHRLIRTDAGLFSPRDAEVAHAASRAWLEKKLDEDFSGQTVVISHHGPHPNSIHPRFAGSPINSAFISDLTPLIAKADLWIHGHVHDSFDYEIQGTRVIANPRGYALNRLKAESLDEIEWENPNFNPSLVIDLG
jgi:Icc-related predicted phosphoesterase